MLDIVRLKEMLLEYVRELNKYIILFLYLYFFWNELLELWEVVIGICELCLM